MTGTIGSANSRGELEVALVVRGHGHDRAGAVTHQHVVGDEDRDASVVRGVDRERADEDAGLLLRLGLPFEIGLGRGEIAVAANRVGRRIGRAEHALPGVERIARESLLSSSSGHWFAVIDVDERVLRRQHHVGGAEQRVRTGREHLDVEVLVALDREPHRRAASTARSSCAA